MKYVFIHFLCSEAIYAAWRLSGLWDLIEFPFDTMQAGGVYGVAPSSFSLFLLWTFFRGLSRFRLYSIQFL